MNIPIYDAAKKYFINSLDFLCIFGYNKIIVDFTQIEVLVWNTLEGILTRCF